MKRHSTRRSFSCCFHHCRRHEIGTRQSIYVVTTLPVGRPELWLDFQQGQDIYHDRITCPPNSFPMGIGGAYLMGKAAAG